MTLCSFFFSFYRYFAGLIVGCLQGASKEELLSPHYSPCGTDYWIQHPMVSLQSTTTLILLLANLIPLFFILVLLHIIEFQVPEVDAIAAGSFKVIEPPDVKATGYVVHSLEAVLWAFHRSSNFKEGCLKVGRWWLCAVHFITV